MMTPKHAVFLMILCPDFLPGEVMIGAMLIAGYLEQPPPSNGKRAPLRVTQKARDEFNAALARLLTAESAAAGG